MRNQTTYKTIKSFKKTIPNPKHMLLYINLN